MPFEKFDGLGCVLITTFNLHGGQSPKASKTQLRFSLSQISMDLFWRTAFTLKRKGLLKVPVEIAARRDRRF